MSLRGVLLVLLAGVSACHAVLPLQKQARDASVDLSDAPSAVDLGPDLADGEPGERDLPVDDLSPEGRKCAQRYGSAPEFELCSATSKTCVFYYRSENPVSCTELCAPALCLDMKDNADDGTCEVESPNSCRGEPCTCDTKMNNSICTCPKP